MDTPLDLATSRWLSSMILNCYDTKACHCSQVLELIYGLFLLSQSHASANVMFQ